MTAAKREKDKGGTGGQRTVQPPNTDLQAEDAGTARSGQPQANVRGTAAKAATQQGKAGKESGRRGR